MGTRLADERWRSASLISTGPVAQLRPTTSTCMASSTVSAAPISVPGSMRPVSSIVTWVCSGTCRPSATMARRAPLTAALHGEEVELGLDRAGGRRRPRGARAPAPRRRRGSRRRRCGPAWGTWCPGPWSRPPSAAARASRTRRARRRPARRPGGSGSRARSANPYSARTTEVEPKVSVSTTSQPTSKKERCTWATRSGRVSTSHSLQPSSSGPPKSSAAEIRAAAGSCPWRRRR